MKKYVRKENGKVVESLKTDIPIEELFHPDLKWEEVKETKKRRD